MPSAGCAPQASGGGGTGSSPPMSSPRPSPSSPSTTSRTPPGSTTPPHRSPSSAPAFFRLSLPMSRPVLVAAGIFALGTIASDFMIASLFLLTQQNQTVTAGLGTFDVALDELAAVAGVNLLAIPVVAISACFARGYVRGLTAALVEEA